MTDVKFPKNLAMNLKRMEQGFSKTKVKILPDIGSSGSVKSNGIVRYRIPGNGIYDLRSIVKFFTGKTTGTSAVVNNLFLHFPRYTSSLIQNISITAGNTVLCSINEYGLLYNALMDHEGADYSQFSKRCTEMFDPTVRYSIHSTPGNDTKLTAGRYLDSAVVNSNDSDVNMCINNFLGFLNSLSTPCIDLTNIGDLFINIQFAPATVLWHSSFPTTTTATLVPTFSGVDFELKDMFITIDRLSFQSATYYQLITQELIKPEGLQFGYYDYYMVAGSLTQKSSGISMNFNVNSASLDQCIATFRREDYNTTRPLVMYGSLGIGASFVSLDEYLSNPTAYTNNVTTGGATALGFTDLGDGFANSVAFVRAGNDIKSSQWSINSINIDPYALSGIEIMQKNLQYLGFMNQDLGTSGVHPSCKSLLHYLKYYFIDICSLENISQDNSMWVSGLDGRQGGINIQYSATFLSTNTSKVYPIIWCRSTRVMKVNAGKQITIDPVPSYAQ